MKTTILLLPILMLAGCGRQPADKEAEGEKVMQTSREWSEAAARGDMEKTVSYWADDAVMIAADQPPLRGRQQIKQMVQESFTMPGFRISWQPQEVEVSECGDMAYLIEDTEVVFKDSTGSTITQHNKAVTIWRKQADGTWKNVVDIATPAPPQP